MAVSDVVEGPFPHDKSHLSSGIQSVDDRDVSEIGYTEEERVSLVRKLDWHILPFIWWCYLFNSLDRNNISNAKSDNMTVDLNFPTNEYGITLSTFYITFSTLAIPGVLLTRKIGPRWTIPGYMLGWSAMAMLNASCTNFAGVLFVRLLLGAFEAGFAASLIFYLTTFYTRGELGARIAVFYSCQARAGSFSGLIVYGVFQLESRLKGWQILLLVEGAFTFAFAVLTAVRLPWSIETASFLSSREKHVGKLRILRDGSAQTDTSFDASKFFKPLSDWRYYAFASIALCYGVAASVASTFATQIIERFGYSAVRTNLFTVAPYAAGTLAMMITAFSSDRFRERGFHLASSLVLVIVGCILLTCLPPSSTGPAYFATFLITMGAYTPSCLFHAWHQCNDPSEDGRAFRVGSLTFLANTGGFVSANIFIDKWAPQYIIPLGITCGIEALALVLVLCLRLYMSADNRRRNRRQNVAWQSKDVPTEALEDGPQNPLFRHFY